MSEQKDLQEQLLLRAQECRKSVLVITTNGFQMRGIITGSDRFVIALKGDGRLQMVYRTVHRPAAHGSGILQE